MKTKQQAKKIQAQDFKAGRVYSLIYTADVDMVASRELEHQTVIDLNKLGFTPFKQENGRCDNPFVDSIVTVRRVSTVQAAGEQTWENFKLKNGMSTEPSNRKAWYHTSPKNDCIVVHNSNGTEYLRGLPRGVTKEQYFVGNLPATAQDVAVIRAFAKSKNSEPNFVTLTLEKLENVASLPDEEMETVDSTQAKAERVESIAAQP